MNEAEIIAATPGGPITGSRLARELRALGVRPGSTLLVHASLSSLGWVAGGAQAVVLALEEALGDGGTLVMPTQTGDLSEPAHWTNPPVPRSWWPAIRAETPAWDPDLTPARMMGAIAECFRKQAGTLRSDHPQVSFAARGPRAELICSGHSLAYGTGERSPLARIYDLNGWVLLLGVDHAVNTSLHLAEYRTDFPGRRILRTGAPVLVDGERRWVEFDDVDVSSDDFAQLGADFERETGLVTTGPVGLATARLMRQRAAVDYAVRWLPRHRRG